MGSPPTHNKIKEKTTYGDLSFMPVAGVEPARYRYQRILSPPRLPIPTHRLVLVNYISKKNHCQVKKLKDLKSFLHFLIFYKKWIFKVDLVKDIYYNE